MPALPGPKRRRLQPVSAHPRCCRAAVAECLLDTLQKGDLELITVSVSNLIGPVVSTVGLERSVELAGRRTGNRTQEEMPGNEILDEVLGNGSWQSTSREETPARVVARAQQLRAPVRRL